MSNVCDFTEGNVTKQILKFYFPMFITNMLQQFYNFVDTAIVGNGLGDDELAAVGNMGSICFLIIGFSCGLANGFSVLIAQNFGAKEYEKLRKNLAASIILAFGIVAILTTASILFLPEILNALQTDEKILADSLKYGYIIFGGLCTAILYNLSASVLRAFGDSKTPLYAIIVSTIINIGLDCLFILVLHTGVEGAAFATVFAQLVSGIICLSKLFTISYAKLVKKDFLDQFSKEAVRRYMDLLKNGVPMAIMNSITAVGCMVVQYFVNGNGATYTAAFSACGKYINLFMQPSCTAGAAMSAFTSQNYGAKRYDRIKEGLRVCVIICLISYVVLGSVMVFGAYQLADIFLNGSEAIALTVSYLRICGKLILIVDLLFVFRSGVQGMGYPTIPMCSGVAEMVLRIGVIVLFSASLGFKATAYAEVAAWSGALLMNLIGFVCILASKLRHEEATT